MYRQVLRIDKEPEILVDRLLSMKGAILSEDVSVYGQQKHGAYLGRICLRKISRNSVEFSENFSLSGPREIIGYCEFNRAGSKSTEVIIYTESGALIDSLFKVVFSILIISSAILFMVPTYYKFGFLASACAAVLGVFILLRKLVVKKICGSLENAVIGNEI